jgi:hypothetical protein
MEEIKSPETVKLLPKKANGFRRFLWKFVLVLLLLTAGYVYWFYYNQYSEGYQSGIVNKISHKGDIFKTYEGFITSVTPNTIITQQGTNDRRTLYFSVVDKKIADSINNIENKIIKLHYVQYRKSLPWRGENYNGKNAEDGQYIIDRIEKVEDVPITPRY